MSCTSHVRPLRRFSFLAVGLLVAAWIALLSPRSEGQEKKKARVPLKGTQTFRYLLHLLQKQPLKALSDLREVNPRRTMIIVLGELDILDRLEEVLVRPQGMVL